MKEFELAVCCMTITFGLLILGLSFWTLKIIHNRKSLRYLRVMTLTIVALSIV